MNYEYTKQELQSFDKDTLLNILHDYNFTISENNTKASLIRKIIAYQNDLNQPSSVRSSKKYKRGASCLAQLPIDVIRLLAFYLSICDIIKICRINKRMNNNICQNKIFLRYLSHQRLTVYDSRLADRNILKEIATVRTLIDASEKGYLEKIKCILKYQRTNILINNALLIAVKNNYLDIVEYLVDHHDVNVHFRDDKALILAVENDNLEMTQLLIENGADVINKNNQIIDIIATKGHLDILQYFTSLDLYTQVGYNELLLTAAANDQVNIVDYVLHFLTEDVYKNEALLSAATNGQLAAIRYLLDYGADIHYRDDFALKLAAKSGYLEAIKYLVSHGADIHSNDNEVFKIAEANDHFAIVEYLLSLDNTHNNIIPSLD